MTPTLPYIISRIQLNELHGLPPLTADPDKQYYFSFWWKDIPLGHLFVEHHDGACDAGLLHRVWQAIAPAIGFYQKRAHMCASDIKLLFLQKNYACFNVVMNRLFEAYTEMRLPEMVDVSVIICTRNRSNDLQRCLLSLFQQTCLPAEIIVIDNAPADDSTLSVVKHFHEVIYYKEPKPGLSVARNAGLRIASSPVIAFTDDDVRLHPLWLYFLSESFAEPHVGAMTGLVLASSLDTGSQQLFEKQWSFNGGYCDKLYDSSFFYKNLLAGPRVWEIGAGANMAFRKTALQAAGFFDERLGAGAAGCSEDSEMWYRILVNGQAIHYNPRAVVFHEHRKELQALHRQLFSYMRGHAVAALIQQKQIKEAGYRRYLYRKITKSYLPLLVKRFFQPGERRMILIQLRGMLSGIFFFFMHPTNPHK
jgi:glycosyltransferase involved in cell wall biosynthesis